MKNKVLIVEDEVIIALYIKKQLESLGYTITDLVSSSEEALSSFIQNTPDIIIMDVKIEGDLNGIEVVLEIRKTSKIPVIFLTGNSDNKTIKMIERLENYFLLVKPVTKEELSLALNSIIIK